MMQEQSSELGSEGASVGMQAELLDWLPLLGIYGVFMLGNLLLPGVLWRHANSRGVQAWIMFFSGVLASEAGILGAWMALRSDRWTNRLLACVLLLALSATCYQLGLQWSGEAVLDRELGLLIYAIALAAWCSAWLGLTLVRTCFGWCIGPREGPQEPPVKTQFSIGYLMAATASAAGITVMIRAALPQISASAQFELSNAVLAITFYVIYGLLLLIPCCGLALRKPTPYWVLFVLLLELYFLGGLVMRCVVWSTNQGAFTAEEVTAFYKYSLGFMSSLLLVFGLLHAYGFELRICSSTTGSASILKSKLKSCLRL